MLPGLHPIRIEFFWQPPDGVSVTVQRPPGIKAPQGVCTTHSATYYLTRAQCLRLLVVSCCFHIVKLLSEESADAGPRILRGVNMS